MKRSKSIWSLALLLVTVAAIAVPFAIAGEGDGHGMKSKQVTVQGILVDTKCYGMNSENWLSDHMTPNGKMPQCAQACANMGIPVGVLKDGKPDNQVYILITPASALAEHMAREVRVTGMPAFDGSGLIPEKILVKNDDGKWEEVKVATMM